MAKTEQAPRAARRTRVRIAAAFVLVAGAAEVTYWAYHAAADRRRQAEEQQRAAKVLADTADPNKARAAVLSGGFTPDTVRRAVADEMRRQVMLRVNGYYDLKTDRERQAFLDKVIDETNAVRKMMEAARPASGGAASPGAAAGGATKNPIMAWVMQQPLSTRVRFAEFGAALNARTASRGLPPVRPPVAE